MSRVDPTLDAEARKQVLLTRIAYEREALGRHVARVQQASTLPRLLRTAFGRTGGRGLVAGAAEAASADGWFTTALAWLRRYRMATTLAGTLFGSTAQLLKPRGWLRRMVTLGAAGTAAYAAYQVWQRAQGEPDDSGL